ncbi:hypothetical protein FH972_006796 [Carpinus fangiana]|uniref:Uncharacterized protein n=1 Tax=Carpinus fangiana TaxID=176857 RepID=A0A5N6QTC8_9ROSI|nr:hypothetical protein FH972_006796 [Carpinus fangiana]
MERGSSSDEEEDRQNLIPQNDDVKHHLPSPRRSAFHIDDLHSTVRRRFTLLHFNKRFIRFSCRPTGPANGSVSESEYESDFQDPSFGAGYGFDKCRKVDQKLNERRTIEWKPKSNNCSMVNFQVHDSKKEEEKFGVLSLFIGSAICIRFAPFEGPCNRSGDFRRRF